MSESKRPESGFLDALFDGAEKIVGGLEKSKELAEPYPEDKEIVDVEFKTTKADIVWGIDKEVSTHHIFEGFKTTALCGRHFDAHQLSNRKTELDDGNYKCCGGCLRILQSKYRNA